MSTLYDPIHVSTTVPPKVTWQDAATRGLWPARAFAAVGIPAATVRSWAARGHIAAVGIGPHNARLYAFTEVVARADGRA